MGKLAKYLPNVGKIDHENGKKMAFIRLKKQNSAKMFMKNITDQNGNVIICNRNIKVALVEGEEEKTYLEKAKEDFENKEKNDKPVESGTILYLTGFSHQTKYFHVRNLLNAYKAESYRLDYKDGNNEAHAVMKTPVMAAKIC